MLYKGIDQANKNIRLGLDSMKAALERLWNPEKEFNVIHVAGTNGKGSVTKFLELMYLEFKQGLRIGKYTSPHLISVTERISVNGQDIPEDKFTELYEKVLEICDDSIELTEFEKITCVAFLYYKEQCVDLVILETGLGGRLDATNVCENKLATVITNIAMDHMDYLGDSLEKIRYEKEGIKRENVAHFEGEDINSSGYPNSITGQNFLLAVKVFEELNSVQLLQEQKQSILNKFESQSRARFDLDLLNKILVDGAHNPAAAHQLAEFVKERIYNEAKTFIIAILDKDLEAFLKALRPCMDQSKDRIIFTKINSNRSKDPEHMLSLAQSIMPEFQMETAIDLAQALKRATGFKIITGSLYLCGEYFMTYALGLFLR